MNLADVAALVQVLRKHPLLEPAQLEEVRIRLQAEFTDPQTLTAELVRRGWLTPYQAGLLLQGRAADLLLGPYVLLELLGVGGMGHVFKARQRKLGRIDAVKIVRAERLGSPLTLARFRREIVAAGQLSHPNVVHAFDAGEAGGRHYFAMEYLAGEDLGRRVQREGPLPFAEACDYARQAALGLQHAHERGLVHRDVKPSNLLLTPEGIVKVLDLGLARLTSPEGTGSGALTTTGVVMGTPDYIAPEQARESHGVDARADIYSLGCTLYFMLSGRPPFPHGPLAAKVAAHLFEEPEPLAVVRPGTPEAVSAVVRKLTAKKPEDRYQTAAEAAAALGRVLAELRDGADAGTAAWTRDAAPAAEAAPPPKRPGLRRVVAGLGAVVLLAAVAAAGVIAISGLGPRPGGSGPPKPPAPGEVTLQCFDPHLGLTVRRKGDPGAGRELGAVPLALPPGDYELELPPDAPAGYEPMPKEISLGPGESRAVRVAGVPLSPWALVSRPAPIDGVLSWTLTTRTGRGPVDHVGYSPDGRWLAAANQDGVVRLFEPATGRLDRALVGHSGVVRALAWSGDKTHPLLATGDGREVRIWDPAAGRLLHAWPVAPAALAWSPDGKTLALATGSQVALWDLEAGRAVLRVGDSPRNLDAVAWSPDGRYIAAGGDAGAVHLWKAPDWAPASYPTNSPVRALAWAPDGSAVAAGCYDGTVHLQPADGSAPPVPLKARDDPVRGVAWSPHGEYVAAVGDKADYTGRVFNAKTGEMVNTIAGFSWGAKAVDWAPDGETLAVGDWSRGIHFYDALGQRQLRYLAGHDDIPSHVAFSPDGTSLATDGESCQAHLWDARTGARLRNFAPTASTYVAGLAWSPDGKRLAGSVLSTHMNIWGVDTGKLDDLGPDSAAYWSAWSPDGALLAGAAGTTVRLFRTDGPGEPIVLAAHKATVGALAWAADGKTLASGADDGATILWDRNGDAFAPRTLSGRQKKVRRLCWSPDDAAMATAGEDGTVCIWDRTSGLNLRTLHVSADAVRSVAWRDAKTLVTISNDGTERFWDAGASDPTRTIRRDPTFGVVFSSDARLNAVGSPAFTARLWDTDTGRPLGTVVLLHQGGLVVSEDGFYHAENKNVENELVVVVQTEEGQRTMPPADFETMYHWKNDPTKARLDTR